MFPPCSTAFPTLRDDFRSIIVRESCQQHEMKTGQPLQPKQQQEPRWRNWQSTGGYRREHLKLVAQQKVGKDTLEKYKPKGEKERS